MDSKEFGLVAAQQLFQFEDLHYGFWEVGDEPTLASFAQAQRKHTAFLFEYIDKNVSHGKEARILDAGCGIGITTRKLLETGYRADGLVPSAWMAEKAKDHIGPLHNANCGKIFHCKFEDLPISSLTEKYQMIVFSESFQYVDMKQSFEIFKKVLCEQGCVVIFDFFKRSSVEGKSPLKGGHSIESFYQTVEQSGFLIRDDVDVTQNLSPNLTLVNNLLVNRINPFGCTLDSFLLDRHPFFYNLLKFFFRKKLKKMKFKYSKERNAENFIKFKTYRMIVLQLSAKGSSSDQT